MFELKLVNFTAGRVTGSDTSTAIQWPESIHIRSLTAKSPLLKWHLCNRIKVNKTGLQEAGEVNQ